MKKRSSERFRSIEEDNFLSGYVNVLVEEKDDGIAQEKIAHAVRKFKEQVKNLRTMSYSKDYVQRFHQLSSGMEVEI